MAEAKPHLSFRWRNFRSFKDTGWIDIKPFTLFIGPNNSGKTSLFYPFLLMKQTIESLDRDLPLKTKGKYVHVGDYTNLIHGHDDKKKLSLEIRFHFHKNEGKKSLKEVGAYPPGTLHLTFRKGEVDKDIELEVFEVGDIFDRTMLKRKLKSDGSYSFKLFKSINKKVGKRLYDTILKHQPLHFFFDSREIIQAGLPDIEELTKKKDKKPLSIKFPDGITALITTLDFISHDIKDTLEKIDYVGPLRQHPKRYYESIGEKPYSVGPMGQFVSDILLQMKKEKSLRLVNDWLKKFGIEGNMNCKEYTAGVFSIIRKDRSSGLSTNIADTGFGVSQILPLITQGLWMEEDRILIAEQPEIHLNPNLQSKLADFFVHLVNSKKKVIVETHSEHLLLWLRTLVAENQIKASDIALYFVEKEGPTTSIRKIPIKDNGHIDGNEWPKGFLEEYLQGALRLATMQSRKGEKNVTKPR